MKKEYKHLNIVMTEMCKRVGVNWKDVNPRKEGWFKKHQWTMTEEEDFLEWAVDYLYNDIDARREMLTLNVRNKSMIRKAFRYFLLSYGWKLKGFL